ncbi:MAG: serine hydrolase [Saprospiraceae bacterium]|nr:serine hydrolase [Candidatus Vicinibacter affinis]
MKNLLFACIVGLVWFDFANAQTFNPILASRLQAKLDSLKTTYRIKGISSCVYFPGEGFWDGISGVSFGLVPIDPDMEFGIGSNTKLFTAVVLLKLAEQNILSVDDSLHRWLPNYKNIDPDITIRQLLNHTSGLADYNNIRGYPDSILSNPNRVFATEELIQWVGPALALPGTTWNYCNTNYLLAGMVAERVTGLTIAQLIRSLILDPLKLEHTFFDVLESSVGTLANPWQNGIDIGSVPRTSLNSAAYSAGAMYSTAREMVVWYQKLMKGQFLQPQSFKELTTFVGTGNYGFGISLDVLGGRVCYAHGGDIRGYRSYVLFDTLSGAFISVLLNSNPAPPRLIAEQLLSVLVNFPVGVNNNSSIQNKMNIFPVPASDLVKIYLDKQRIQRIKIYALDGKLVAIHSETEFSIADLPEGIYMVVAETEKSAYTSKLVKR